MAYGRTSAGTSGSYSQSGMRSEGKLMKFLGPRALTAGGTPNVNTIDFFNISQQSNALDFGDLTIGRDHLMGCSSGIRCVHYGGNDSPDTSRIDYNTFMTLGNAADFGEMTGQGASGKNRAGSCPDGNRGVFAGGTSPTTALSNMEYVTIGTTSSGIEFATMTGNRDGQAGVSDGVRGITCGGNPPLNAAEYFNIGHTADALDWGEIAVAQIFAGNSGSSDGSRGVLVGGYGGGTDRRDTVQYVTIGSNGTSVDYGELAAANYGPGTSSDGARACTVGGSIPPGNIDQIQFHQINQGGTALDFGELTQARSAMNSDSGG